MYTLSDILAVINKSLELEREKKGIEAKGHFSHSTYSFNDNGDVVWEVFVYFFVDENHKYPVLRLRHKLDKELFSDKEKEAHKFDMNVLTYLWQLIKFGKGEYDYTKFVDGTFNM